MTQGGIEADGQRHNKGGRQNSSVEERHKTLGKKSECTRRGEGNETREGEDVQKL